MGTHGVTHARTHARCLPCEAQRSAADFTTRSMCACWSPRRRLVAIRRPHTKHRVGGDRGRQHMRLAATSTALSTRNLDRHRHLRFRTCPVPRPLSESRGWGPSRFSVLSLRRLFPFLGCLAADWLETHIWRERGDCSAHSSSPPRFGGGRRSFHFHIEFTIFVPLPSQSLPYIVGTIPLSRGPAIQKTRWAVF
jgi:hypothetical protein